MSEQSLLSRKELIDLLREDKEFRDAFALEYVKNSIPSQLRALRKERDWTQADLGKEAKKPRNVITRLENPNNNIPNLLTMYEVAVGCEAALLVKVIPFSELLKEYEKPFEAMHAPKITSKSEIEKLAAWAREVETQNGEETPEISKTVSARVISKKGESSRTAIPEQPELKGLGFALVPNSKNTISETISIGFKENTNTFNGYTTFQQDALAA